MILIKLGGSIISDKKNKEFIKKIKNEERMEEQFFKKEVVNELIREIGKKRGYKIIVHGAGLFGHPLAEKYKLKNGFKNFKQIGGVAKVQRDVKDLNLKILNLFIENGINAISLPPSSFVEFENKKIINFKILKEFMKLGFTPILFGDVVIDRKIGFTICSGDDLMLALAKIFLPKKVIFITDVEGIFLEKEVLVKRIKIIKLKKAIEFLDNINNSSVKEVLEELEKKDFIKVKREKLEVNREMNEKVSDITGSMVGKLKIAFKIAKYSKVWVIEGKGVKLKELLFEKKVVGTEIKT